VEELSSSFYLVVLIVSTMLIALVLIFALVNRREKEKNIEKRLGALQNTFAIFSLFIGIISMFIAWSSFQSSIKNPDIEIVFLTGQGENWLEVTEYDKLHLTYTKDGGISASFSYASSWGTIQLRNNGNIGTSNLKVSLTFSNIWFRDQPTDYTANDHVRGHGGFLTLERNISETINPGDFYNLPHIPWDHFEWDAWAVETDLRSIEDALGSTSMKITIYEGSIKKFEQTYDIDMIEFESGDSGYRGFTEDDKARLREPMSAIYDNYKFDPKLAESVYDLDYDHFNQPYPNDAYSFEIKDLHGLEFVYVQRCYFYYLGNLKAYNPFFAEDAKENTIFWGRLYYRYRSEQSNADYSVQDIEALVANDILSRQS